MNGLIFNIQRFSIHDGPGIRTTVFFKGCNLRCFWCHNPESIHKKPQIQIFQSKCIGCGRCFEVCPENLHKTISNERVFIRDLCRACGKCAESCYAGALVMTGKEMTINEVVDQVIRDKVFYENSGGGVTLSGGEAMLQKDFAKSLLIECKKNQLHTVVDTAGCVPWITFEEIIPFTDLFLYDIKCMDNEKHISATGTSNRLILNNLKKLAAYKSDIIIRIPIIPGFNDGLDHFEKIGEFLYSLETVKSVELLPFHKLGEGKYKSLQMDYMAKEYQRPLEEKIGILAEILRSFGFSVKQ